MNDMEYNIAEIKRRAVECLEKTKQNINLIKIREELFDIAKITELKDEKSYKKVISDLEKIEEYIYITEIFELKTEDYIFLKNLAEELRNQRIRRDDKVKNEIFMIEDKKGNKHYSLTRNFAEQYMDNKKEYFTKDSVINIVEDNNKQLDLLLQLIERSF